MKRTLTFGTISIVLAAALATSLLLSQEKGSKDAKDAKDAAKKKSAESAGSPAAGPDMAEMMKQWMAIATPGEGHKRLEPLVGAWDATSRIWMAGPGGPATESKGSETSKWVLGKRFIVSEFRGEMVLPGADGQPQAVPFEGLGMCGYDNFRNMYISTWADSMGTQLLTMTGSADPSGKVISYYGSMDEPALKVVGRMVRYVTRIIDEDHHVFEMYDLHAGPDHKVMQIDYVRKKS